METQNYKLTLQFDGTAYHGWQRQTGWPTVQEVVERAVARTVSMPVHVQGCGRTDAGVHALAFVANFKTASRRAHERMQGALNARLPDDVAVIDCQAVPEAFHSQFDAVGKVYRYSTRFGSVRPVLDRHFVNYCPGELDPELIRPAAAHLVGTHDFASFVTQLDPEKDTVRTIWQADVQADANTIAVTFSGDGFMYNMVRAMAGCLLEVGKGNRPPEWVKEVLEAADRKQSAATARAKGLCLVKALYPGDPEVPPFTPKIEHGD